MHDFKKDTYDAEKKLIDEINKCSREKDNLVKWPKLYDEQLNNYQQEIYNLNIKLYFSSQQTTRQKTSLSQPQQSQQTQQQPQQTPTFKSLDDYFRGQK